MIEDGAEVEQGLRGVLVHSISRVEYGEAGLLLEEPGSSGGVVAEDDGFCSEGAESESGILQGFAFFDAGGEAGNQSGVGAEALGG